MQFVFCVTRFSCFAQHVARMMLGCHSQDEGQASRNPDNWISLLPPRQEAQFSFPAIRLFTEEAQRNTVRKASNLTSLLSIKWSKSAQGHHFLKQKNLPERYFCALWTSFPSCLWATGHCLWAKKVGWVQQWICSSAVQLRRAKYLKHASHTTKLSPFQQAPTKNWSPPPRQQRKTRVSFIKDYPETQVCALSKLV